MKKYFSLVLLFILTGICLVVLSNLNPVNAEQPSSPAANRRPEIIQKIQDKKEERKEDRIIKVKNLADIRVNHFNRLINMTEKLLDKIQVRINKAKTAGKDVTELTKLMTDARSKIADAKAKYSEANSLKDTINNKAGLQDVQKRFKAIRDDLKVIRQDVSKMIKILKGFNSATSNGKNPQAEGTNPGILSR